MEHWKILQAQSSQWRAELSAELEDAVDETAVYQAYARSLKEYADTAYARVARARKMTRFEKAQLEDFARDAKSDLTVLGGIIHSLAQEMGEIYNDVQDFGTAIRNRTQYYDSILTDLKIMQGRDVSETVFRDQLTDYSMLDVNEMTGVQAGVSTAEGISHLAILSQKTLTPEIHDLRISGNGQAGNSHVARVLSGVQGMPGMETLIGFESDLDAHDAAAALADGEAQTWYEYQLLGTDRTDLIEGTTAKESGEILTLKIQILFKSAIEFNWMDIAPYLPDNLAKPMRVYSIKVTTDGAVYEPLYKDKSVMDIPLQSISQRYSLQTREDELVRYAAQGVFLCPKTKATGIEIILRQDCAYSEALAAYQYDWIVEKSGKVLTRVRMKENQIPQEIREGLPGKYVL